MEIPPHVYADTSVYGGILDDEFATASRAFFEQVQDGRFSLAVSIVVMDELEAAPEAVQSQFRELARLARIVDINEQALSLQQAYLDAGILTLKSKEDALHVALATVGGCSTIVSWNFRHIVHFQKIPKYNAVNVLKGFGPIAIHSPLELIGDVDNNH